MSYSKILPLSITSVLFIFLLAPLAAIGQPVKETLSASPVPVFQDQITLRLTAEEWLSSNTAQVNVTIVASFDEKESAAIQTKVTQNLKKITPGASWKITSFGRTMDASGFERWTIRAETRLADSAMAGLRQKLKDHSAPGFMMTLEGIVFTPTLSEREGHNALLRKNIYQQTREELKNLKSIFPHRDYRVSAIVFSQSTIQYAPATLSDNKEMVLQKYRVNRDLITSSMNVSSKIKMHATVSLSVSHLPTREK